LSGGLIGRVAQPPNPSSMASATLQIPSDRSFNSVTPVECL
jgi:hypothetical protein